MFLYFQTPNGNVEAKVMCFFRRRDLPNTLIMLADKHQSEYTQYSLLELKHNNYSMLMTLMLQVIFS
jgi:hypothetical protein